MKHKDKPRTLSRKANSKAHNWKTESSSPQGMRREQHGKRFHFLYSGAEPSPRSRDEMESYLQYHSINESKSHGKNRKFLLLSETHWKITLNVIGFLCILIGCLYQSCTFLSLYFVYPTTVEFNVENEAVLDFPAVTLCNSNPVRYKLWCEEDATVCTRKPNETMEAIRLRHENQYNALSKERRIRLGNQFDDFLMYAEYEDEVVNEQFTWYYDYEFTNCYTFNAVWGAKDQTIRTAVLFNPVSGKSSELIMCVNIDVDNYSNLTGTIVGRVKMTIHSNDIVPNPTYDASSLEAGEFYSYGVQKVTTELLESPYQTRCRNYEKEKEVRTGARMSQKNCLLECFKTETEKLCGCTYRRLSLMYDGTPCEYESQNHCLGVVEEDVFNICNPQCPMACKKIEFQFVATDSEPLRKESSLYEKMTVDKFFKTREEMEKNMACFRIHYGSTETRTLSYRPKYEFIELFSLLGGYSGLWLGFSLLNCYEFVLSKVVYFRHKKKASNNKGKIKKIRKRKFYNT